VPSPTGTKESNPHAVPPEGPPALSLDGRRPGGAGSQFPVVAAGVNKGLGQEGQPFLITPTTDVAGVEKAGGSAKSGTFIVSFAAPVRNCQWAATPAEILNQESGRGVIINVRPSQFDERDVFVFTQRLETTASNKGLLLDEPHSFSLVGRC
jgi:hypothetical protein